MTSELLTTDGKRKYLTQDEQGRFLDAASELDSAKVRIASLLFRHVQKGSSGV